MKNKEIKINNQRITFSKRIKRKVLLELSQGKSLSEVIKICELEELREISSDKKYIAKLFYKWRKEMSENKAFMQILHHNITKEMLEDEIDSIGDDEELDKQEEDDLSLQKRLVQCLRIIEYKNKNRKKW